VALQGLTLVQRHPGFERIVELAFGVLRLLHKPEDPPINTAYLVQRPGSSTNPHVTLVREHLPAAAKTW
jgi:hypothetical protein